MPIIIEKTIGKLRQTKTIEEDFSKLPFAVGNFISKDLWEGKWDSYLDEERIIFQNGESKEIVIEGFIFDNNLKSHSTYFWQNGMTNHCFKINGMSPTGRVFEINFEIIGKDSILVYMIYAMVLISYYGEDKALEVWDNLQGRNQFSLIENTISVIRDLKDKEISITNKYPFMKLFFQNGIDKLIEKANSMLNQLDFLK